MAKIVNKEKNVVTIEFEITPEKFEEGVQKAYLKNRKNINIPGFRKGRAPRKLIESRYGKGVFYEDALDIVIPPAYEEALEETKLDPIDQPKLDIKEFEEGKNIVITADVEVKPEVELAIPEEVEVVKVISEVDDEQVENSLKEMQEKNARIINVEDRPVKEGDTVTIDYKGFIGEEEFEGGSAENQSLEIGSKSFIPGFEEQLVGKNSGEDVEVKVTFPEEYSAEELAGKEATFNVKIHEIKEKELPKLDDEFAKDVSEFDTIDELRKDTKENLIKKAKDNEKITNQNNAITEFVSKCDTVVPEVLIDREIENQLNGFRQQLAQQGIKLEDYTQMIGQEMDELKENLRPQAETSVKTELVIEAVANKHDFEITEEELNEELKKLANSYGIGEDKLDDFIEKMKEDSREYIEDSVKRRKAVEYITDNVKMVEKKEEAEEKKDENNSAEEK
ncbi:MAG TPA: trigger factor [Clostridiales bacterium]|nr:trigger factor [Clostridiales bacterium]